MFWGFSPALNLIEEYQKHYKCLPEVLNIFIIGGSDARHILNTVSRLHKYENLTVNFYLVDFCLELVARQLLLLNVALEDEKVLNIDKKTRFFMEIYGNTLLRPSIAKFLTTKANYLTNYITRDLHKPCEDKMKTLDVSGLKYKERDYLENLFKFWATDIKTYDLSKFWDDKVRKALGVRYDNKFGVFDWDLHMKLHQIGADLISIQEYKEFRSTGVSFTWLQSEVSKYNRSFASGVIPNGENKFIHRGYLGDITIGPYIAYGLSCDREEMLKTQHGVNNYRATDITEYNIKQICYQIIHGRDYKPKIKEDKEDVQITEITEENNEIKNEEKDVKINETTEENNEITNEEKEVKITEENNEITIEEKNNLSNVKICILPCLQNLRNLPNSVDVLWMSNIMVDFFSNEFVNTLVPTGALVIFEGIKYNPENRTETFEKYQTKIKGFGKILGENTEEICFDPQKDDFAKFLFKK